MSFNGMAVWRVRVWLFAIAVLLIAGQRPSEAERVVMAQAGCPASMTKAVRRFFAFAQQAPRVTSCGHQPDQRAVLSRVPIEEFR